MVEELEIIILQVRVSLVFVMSMAIHGSIRATS
jgi:hypothetical protein